MGFSSRGYPARFRARLRRTCAWPALWSVRSREPPPGPKAEKRLSWGLRPYGTFRRGGSGSPGDSCPRHLPPSGFDYPPGGFLSSTPGDGPSTAAAPMGFALQGLAPPRRRYLSRGLASPVVLPVRPKAGGRDSRGWLRRKRGPARRRPKAETAEPCPLGIMPLQGFLLRPPSDRLPGPVPSCPAAGDAPYGPRPARASGGFQWRKRPGLSRDCRPSWGLAPHRTGGF